MGVQVSLGFATDLGLGGAWEEVYQTNFTDPQTAADAWNATTGLIGLSSTSVLGKRLACLSSQCYMYFARFGLIDSGTSVKSILSRGQSFGYRSAENFAGDCASMRIYNTAGTAHRQVRLAGLPDNVVVDNQIQKSFIQSYILGGSGFLQAFGSTGGVIRYRNTIIGGESSQPISSVVKQNQTSTVSIVMAAPISGLHLGSTVVVSVRGQPQFRGNWVVAAINTDQTTIVLRGSERISAPTNPAGYVTLAGFSIQGVSVGTSTAPLNPAIVFLAPHKLGKKKYQRSGRRSPILIRH